MIDKIKSVYTIVVSALGALFLYLFISKKHEMKQLRRNLERQRLEDELGHLKTERSRVSKKAEKKVQNYKSLLKKHPDLAERLGLSK